MNEPHLIGCIPAIDDQTEVAFYCWLGKYKHIVVQDPAIKNQLDIFIEKLVTLKSDHMEWNSFLTRWKLNRMLHGDDVILVWGKVKLELNIKYPTAEITDNSDNINESDDMKQEDD